MTEGVLAQGCEIAERRGEGATHVARVPHPPAAALEVPDSSSVQHWVQVQE